MAVIVTQITHLGSCHKHQVAIIRERLEPLTLQLPAVVLNPLVTLVVGHSVVAVVLTIPRRVRRGESSCNRELRALTRVDRLVDGRTTKGNLHGELVCHTILHNEVVPILQCIATILSLDIEREVRVGPLESLTQTESYTERTEVHSRRLPDVVGVVLLRPVCRHSQRVRLTSTHPRVGEARSDSLIVCTVGLSRDRELLVLSHRVRTPRALLEHITCREVVQSDTHRAHERA